MKAKQLEAAAIVPPTPGWYIPDARFQNKFPPRQVLAVGNGFVYFTDTKTHKESTIQKFDAWCRKTGAVRP
jgi:hypothetical protein